MDKIGNIFLKIALEDKEFLPKYSQKFNELSMALSRVLKIKDKKSREKEVYKEISKFKKLNKELIENNQERRIKLDLLQAALK